jgi:hypothetical protein
MPSPNKTRFFSCGLIATLVPSEDKLSNGKFVRREFPMTQLAHATESHSTLIEKVIYTAKAGSDTWKKAE